MKFSDSEYNLANIETFGRPYTSARKTKHFIGVFMTAVDRIKCRYAHSGMTSGVGGFQNPGVCLQAFPSFLPHPLPAYSRHFSRGPCSETARKRLLRRLGECLSNLPSQRFMIKVFDNKPDKRMPYKSRACSIRQIC